MQEAKVYQNHQGKIAIMYNKTPSTVYTVEEGDCTQHRVVSFLKDYTVATKNGQPYSPAIAADKILSNQFLTISDEAKHILKGLKAMEATIITVNKSAEFINRFVTEEDAVKYSDADTIIINHVEDLNIFTKQMLAEAIKMVSNFDCSLKHITKQELVERLYAEYSVMELPSCTSSLDSNSASNRKEAKGKKSGGGLMYKLHRALEDNYVLMEAFIEEHGSNLRSFQSAVSYIKNPKYCGKLVPISSTTLGTVIIDGKDYDAIIKTENLEKFPEFKQRERKVMSTGEKAPRAAGARQKIREFFETGNSGTRKEIAEKLELELKVVSDNVCYLKNPKFAGKQGPLNLVTDPETKVISLSDEPFPEAEASEMDSNSAAE